jgi:hypothetical protein
MSRKISKKVLGILVLSAVILNLFILPASACLQIDPDGHSYTTISTPALSGRCGCQAEAHGDTQAGASLGGKQTARPERHLRLLSCGWSSSEPVSAA